MWRTKRKAGDFDAEISSHLELETDRLIAEGMSPEDARYKAQRTFGNTTSARERFYESGRVLWLDQLAQDLRFALRMLRKSPGFSCVAILTLALGIGANTAIFSVVNGVVLRPLPYPEPDRLVSISERIRGLGESTFAYLNFLDCQQESRSFERMAAWRFGDGLLSTAEETKRVRGRQISADFLNVLGVKPALGRGFLSEEDRAGAAPVAVISDGLWRRRFGADPQPAGGRQVFNGKAYTIVGVLPADFRYFRSVDIFTPIGQNTDFPMRNREMHPGIRVIARVRPEVSLPQAQLEMNLIAERLAAAYPKSNADHSLMVRPLIEDFVGDVRRTLFLLLGAVGMVLLIACANVAGLLLARSVSRSREFAIRSALGASRGRVVRQALTESVLLAMAGGALGFALAFWGTGPLLLAIPDLLPRMEEIAPDFRVFLFTLGATLLTGILFGLAPAVQDFGGHPEQALKQGARTVTGGPRRLQTTFVVAETALALVLLVGAGLMIRTVLRLWSVNPGFDPKGILTASVRLSPSVMGEPMQIRAAWDQLLESVRRIPGVRSAAAADVIPLTGEAEQTQYWTGLPAPAPDRLPFVLINIVTPEYLKVMSIPLLEGRFLTDQDRAGVEAVVVIDDVMARRAFAGKDPVGATLWLKFVGPARIIGVVGHIKHRRLQETDRDAEEQAYIPFGQLADSFMRLMTGQSLTLRTSLDPASVVDALRRVRGSARDQAIYDIRPMEQILDDSIARQRFLTLLLAIFAGIALVLASVGIYGVISYLSSQRVPEIGIRMALGADSAGVLRMVLWQGLKMCLAGVGIGLVVAAAAARLMQKMIYGVSPSDPLTLACVTLILAAVALIASYLPARRASLVDPLAALRHE